MDRYILRRRLKEFGHVRLGQPDRIVRQADLDTALAVIRLINQYFGLAVRSFLAIHDLGDFTEFEEDADNLSPSVAPKSSSVLTASEDEDQFGHGCWLNYQEKNLSLFRREASSSKVLPHKDASGRKLSVEKTIRNCPRLLLDLEKTPLGGRLRFLRKRQGLTQAELERRTGISRITICKLERGGPAMRPEIVGKLLAYFGQEAGDAFPEGDP